MAREWAARRAEFRAAAASDRARAAQERENTTRAMEQEVTNATPIYIGLVAVVLLVIGGWFVLDRLRCDPILGKVPTWQMRHTCQ